MPKCVSDNVRCLPDILTCLTYYFSNIFLCVPPLIFSGKKCFHHLFFATFDGSTTSDDTKNCTMSGRHVKMSGRHVKMSERHLATFLLVLVRCLGDMLRCLRGMLRCLGDMLRCPGDILAFFLSKMSERHVQMSGGHVK